MSSIPGPGYINSALQIPQTRLQATSPVWDLYKLNSCEAAQLPCLKKFDSQIKKIIKFASPAWANGPPKTLPTCFSDTGWKGYGSPPSRCSPARPPKKRWKVPSSTPQRYVLHFKRTRKGSEQAKICWWDLYPEEINWLAFVGLGYRQTIPMSCPKAPAWYHSRERHVRDVGLGLVNDGVLLAKMIMTVLVGTANAGQNHLGAPPKSPFAYIYISYVCFGSCLSPVAVDKKKVNKVHFIEMMRLFTFGYRILATPNVCCMVVSKKNVFFPQLSGPIGRHRTQYLTQDSDASGFKAKNMPTNS